MEPGKTKKILISGASVAGLSTAWWMKKLGHQVTIVEVAAAPRTGGAAIDVREDALAAVKSMGIFDQLKAVSLHVELVEFKNAVDGTEGSMSLKSEDPEFSNDDIEIERGKFFTILSEGLNDGVEFIYNNSIVALSETKDDIRANFKDGSSRAFDLVIGCDGSHSAVRTLWFGDESAYTHFLGAYFSITIVNKLLIPQKTMQMYGVPNKAVMVNAYNNKTDIIFCFNSDEEIPYDYKNISQQRKIILEQFAGQRWRIPELLEEVEHSASFYFDKFCQIKMPSWTKGRVALVGDAAYCASPAAGMGASLAIAGAAALADALQKHDGDFNPAFDEYNMTLRPFIDKVQTAAESNVKTFIPATEEDIRKRNTEGF